VELKREDLVYLFGFEEHIKRLCAHLEVDVPDRIERCVIFGGGDLGISIARKLLEHGKEVKIVEEDIGQCKVADEALEGEVMTLSSKYGTAELFEEEGLAHADMMIAATGNDEYNIVKCLEAKEHGIRKVLAINNEIEYYNLMHSLGLVVVRGPKMSAYHRIIEQIHSSQIITERKYCGGKGVILLRKIFARSPLIGKRIKPLSGGMRKLFYLIRNDRLSPILEAIEICEEDLILAFVYEEEAERMEQWLNGL